MKDLNIEIKNALKESVKKAFDYEANEEILVEIQKKLMVIMLVVQP